MSNFIKRWAAHTFYHTTWIVQILLHKLHLLQFYLSAKTLFTCYMIFIWKESHIYAKNTPKTKTKNSPYTSPQSTIKAGLLLFTNSRLERNPELILLTTIACRHRILQKSLLWTILCITAQWCINPMSIQHASRGCLLCGKPWWSTVICQTFAMYAAKE